MASLTVARFERALRVWLRCQSSALCPEPRLFLGGVRRSRAAPTRIRRLGSGRPAARTPDVLGVRRSSRPVAGGGHGPDVAWQRRGITEIAISRQSLATGEDPARLTTIDSTRPGPGQVAAPTLARLTMEMTCTDLGRQICRKKDRLNRYGAPDRAKAMACRSSRPALGQAPRGGVPGSRTSPASRYSRAKGRDPA